MADTEGEAGSFVAARRRELARFRFMLTGDRAAGEDLLQEALVRCLPSWGRFDPQGLEGLCAQGDGPTRLEGPPAAVRQRGDHLTGADLATADVAESSAELTDLRRALATLPSQQRVVLVLRYWQDLDEAEIANLLGCRQGTVKSRASRAYAQLRQQLDWTGDVAIVEDPSAAGKDLP